MHSGRPMTLMSPILFLANPLNWLRAISRYRATASGGPNFAFDLCVRRSTPDDRDGLDLSSWTTAYNGAESVRAETMEAFAEAFAPHGFSPTAFYPCYGLAEATLMVSGGDKDAGPTSLDGGYRGTRTGALRARRCRTLGSPDQLRGPAAWGTGRDRRSRDARAAVRRT